MPNYEYRCKACGVNFTRDMSMRDHDRLSEFLASPTTMMAGMPLKLDTVRCPACNDIRVEQQLASFFAKTSRKS